MELSGAACRGGAPVPLPARPPSPGPGRAPASRPSRAGTLGQPLSPVRLPLHCRQPLAWPPTPPRSPPETRWLQRGATLARAASAVAPRTLAATRHTLSSGAGGSEVEWVSCKARGAAAAQQASGHGGGAPHHTPARLRLGSHDVSSSFASGPFHLTRYLSDAINGEARGRVLAVLWATAPWALSTAAL